MKNPSSLSIYSYSFLILCLVLSGCKDTTTEVKASQPLEVPRGYVKVLQIEIEDKVFGFGPFVGYYFKPTQNTDLTRLDFVCFNERSFYTTDLEENSLLYKGTAIFQQLPETGTLVRISSDQRITPIFFQNAPPQWINSRPEPREEFVHFHSAYNHSGAVNAGYWIKHVAQASFIYNMGGRVRPESPLYHEVTSGVDRTFARIIEFDRGPGEQ